MADIAIEFQFNTTLTQQEFSLVTRTLAGHKLKSHDITLAKDLNKRLLDLRIKQLKGYLYSSERALTVAMEESKEIEPSEV